MEHKPDLIFSHLEMPNKDGFKFISAVRKMEQFLKTPINVISALDRFPHINKALDLGATDYIERKSMTSGKMRAKINKSI